jgi:uncharacterized membrane protein
MVAEHSEREMVGSSVAPDSGACADGDVARCANLRFAFEMANRWQRHGARLSFYAIAFGLIASLLAVPAGLVDWTGIKKEKPAWKIGLYHLALNVVVTALFAINLGLRLQDFRDASIVATAPLTLSILGTAILIASAYLGG